MRDYYEILGVQKGATEDEIKKAFRKKAHELHPDKGGDEAAFKEVNEAYQVLGDQKKRQTYDQFGHAAFQQGGMGNAGGSQGGYGGFGGFDGVNINMDDLGDLGDVIGSMFGFQNRGKGTGKKGRGKDVEVRMNVDFLDAFHGATRDVSLRMLAECETCGGSGAAKGASISTCSVCGGRGQVMRAQQTPFGVFQSTTTCSKCHGAGKSPEKECPTCGGSGVHEKTQTLSVRIPAGINNGEIIKLSGAGEPAPFGGTKGDVYIHISIKEHSVFHRDGNDIRHDAFIPLTIFLLGGKAMIPGVDGEIELKIPEGTQSGTVFKLRGKGFPYLHGHGTGDQYVTVYPDIPKRLEKRQKKLLEELGQTGM